MNRPPRGLALLLGLTLLSLPSPAPAQSSDQALLETIAESWRRREEATRSVEIVWEETETIPRDALTNHPGLNRQAELGEAGKAPFPPADTTLVRKGRAILQGDRIRYEGEREHLGEKADIWHDTYISAYDGHQTKTLWRTSRSEWPSGQIWNEPFFHDRPMLEIAPILLSLRPANAVLGKVPLQACRVSSARPAGGANADCVILVEDTGPGSRVEYWLQPAADYAIVRKTTKSGGKVRTDHEIQYNHDAASGVWLPSDWKITWFKRWDDKIHFTLHGRVTSCKLNVASAANTFDLEFPSDALVSIMGDTPETTIDLVEHRRSWLEWGAIAGGLLAAGLLVAGLLRRRKRWRSSPVTLRGTLAIAMGLSMLVAARPGHAQNADQALLETIAEAWRRREEATRSVEIVWEETETIPQGALTNHPALIASGQPPDKGPRPPTDVTLKHDKSAVLSGDQIRYEGTKDRLGANSEVWKDHYLSTYDGRQSKNLWYPRNDAPVGQVWNEPFYHDRSSFDVVPILLSFRPGNGELGKVDLQKCRVSRARPGGAKSDCVILVEDIAPGSRVEYWLRPEADFALVHRTAISNGVVETDDDFQYARDPASGVWLPVGWRITWFKLWDGKIYFTLRGRVTACKLNAEPATGTFDLAFPRDALVSIMGATPETTIDIVEHEHSLAEWVGLVGGLVATGLLATYLLRRHFRTRRASLN